MKTVFGILIASMWLIMMIEPPAQPQQQIQALAQTTAAPPALEACPAEAPPNAKHVELDPKPARYSGPACLNGEQCTTPPDWFEQDGYKLTDQGAEITYEDRGQLYTHDCPEGSVNSFWFEEDRWVKHDAPACWKFEPVKISDCNQ